MWLLYLVAMERAAASEPLDVWFNRTPAINTNYLSDVVYANSRFVVVGDSGTILFSADGTEWEAASSGTTEDLHAVTFGNGLFVVGGSKRILLTSSDGVQWQKTSSGSFGSLYCGTFGDGQFLFGGSRFLVSSSTGDEWIPRNQPFPEVLDGLVYGNGRFVGSGWDNDTYAPALYTSSDGLQWTPRDPKTTMSLDGATYGGGLFVVVGDSGAITTSPDGDTWTQRPSGTENTLWDVAFGSNTFVAVGWDGTILSSGDGLEWKLRPGGMTNALYGVGYGNSTFVAVGRFGTIVQSAPVAAASNGALKLSKAAANGSSFSFEFNGEVGQAYQIQGTENLTRWLTLTNMAATSSPTICVLHNQGSTHRSYRVVKP